MSDTSQGDGWWQASDLKWYPPELHADPAHRLRYAASPSPETAPPAPDPIPPASTGAAATPGFPLIEPPAAPPTSAPAPAPDPSPSMAAPMPGPSGGGSKTPSARAFRANNSTALLWGGALVLLVGLVVAALLLAFGSGSDDDDTASVVAAPADEPDTGPGAGSSSPAQTPEVTAGTNVGSIDRPAAFGEVYGWPEWRGTIVDVIDTADTDLVDRATDPPPPGRTDLVVIYEATYLGSDISSFEPFLIGAPGTTIHETYACLLESEQLLEVGIDYNRFELVPGQTARFAECIEVATSDVDGLRLSLDNVNQFAQAAVFAADGEPLPPLAPAGVSAGSRRLDTVPLGTELRTDEWTAAVTEVFDAAEAGVVAAFASPPRDGHRYLAVAYEATYEGTEASDFIPLRVTGIGAEVYEPINNCWLDADAMAARGIDINRFELPSRETAVLGTCLEVPIAADTLVIRLEDGFSFEDASLLYPAS